jgi:hypothetical protein
MDKLTFSMILEGALLNYDGVGFEELVSFGIKPELARAGIKLKEYLTGENKKEVLKNELTKPTT